MDLILQSPDDNARDTWASETICAVQEMPHRQCHLQTSLQGIVHILSLTGT